MRADSDFSLLFIETSGCLPMCGHATLGSITFALEAGLIEPKVPGTVVVDVPAGQIHATYIRSGDKVSSVCFTNVPSFLLHRDLAIDFPPLGLLKVDIAYGGNFYPIIEVQPNYPGCEHFSPQQLLEWGRDMQDLVNRSVDVIHPQNPAIKGVKHCRFWGRCATQREQAPSAQLLCLTFDSCGLIASKFATDLHLPRSSCRALRGCVRPRSGR